MADYNYRNFNPKAEDTRYKVNNNIIRMMNANPALGIGYILGNAIGENYWGKKRANRRSEVKDAWKNLQDSNGGEVKYSGTSKEPNYYDSMNKALDEYKGISDGAYIDTAKGIYPKTPQQANKSTETPTVGKMWESMKNGSGYNAGNTGLFTNGARNMDNVIGADANGVYGVPAGGSAPSAANIPRSPQMKAPNPNPTPIPYTAEQLAQIQAYGKFTPEELQRMGAGQLVAPPVQTAPTQSGGLLTNVANNAARTVPNLVVPEDRAAALDRWKYTVPEEEAGMAEGLRARNNFSRASATPAGAADLNSRYIMPGHDDSLTLGAIFGNANNIDPEIQAKALEYLKNLPG